MGPIHSALGPIRFMAHGSQGPIRKSIILNLCLWACFNICFSHELSQNMQNIILLRFKSIDFLEICKFRSVTKIPTWSCSLFSRTRQCPKCLTRAVEEGSGAGDSPLELTCISELGHHSIVIDWVVLVMSCPLCNVKPLPEPMLTCYQIRNKCTWKCCLQNM